MKVAVLGAQGLLGQAFCSLCDAEGIEYLPFGRQCRIDNALHLDEVFNYSFTHLINYAGLSSPGACEAEPNKCWASHVLGTELILERLFKRPDVRALFLGSSKMSDDSEYGGAKRTAFEMVTGYRQLYGLPVFTAVQHSTVCEGSGEDRWDGKIQKYIAELIQWMQDNKLCVENLYFDDEWVRASLDNSAWNEAGEKAAFPKLRLRSINFSRDWISCEDAARAHLLGFKCANSDFEVGSGKLMSAAEYLKLAFGELNWQDFILYGIGKSDHCIPAQIDWLAMQGWVASPLG